MASQTSESVRPVDEIERLCGGVDTRPGECEQHGCFVDVLYRRKGEEGVSEGWGGCPECGKVLAEKRREADERNRLADMARERVDHYLTRTGISRKFADCSLENYRPVNDKANKHLSAVRAYADLVSGKEHKGRCLILSGNVGCGKTHLAAALTHEVIRNTAQPCSYVSFDDLISMAKETFSKNADMTERALYKSFTKYRLLVIDEVGMQNFTDFEQTVAYKVINARYLEELPTVLGTNVPVKSLRGCIGDRAVDRLRENGGRALDFDWKSYRQGGDA